MAEAYLLGGVRTPIGKFLGALSSVPAPRLASVAIRRLLEQLHLAPGEVEEVIAGQVLTAGVGQAPARQAALAAGLPESVAAVTVNKVCGSGLKAAMLAAQAIRCGDASLVVAAGMESMSQAPFLLPRVRQGWKFGHQQAVDHMLHDGLWCAFENQAMGQVAEETATRYQVSREEQDRFAAESHRRAVAAWEQGAFQAEVVPVPHPKEPEQVLLARDEGPRPDTTPETLDRLRPVFSAQGTVTAGNASQLSDGAAAVVLADEETAHRVRSPLTCRVVASVTVGAKPRDLFIAPVEAIRRVVAKAGIELAQVDLVELNEAFAAQMVACLKQLELEPERVNVHGGAVALGHPIGASGTRVLVTLMHALARYEKQFGVAALCLGGGNAVAMLIQRVGSPSG